MRKNILRFLGTLMLSVSVLGNVLVHGEKPWDFNDDKTLLISLEKLNTSDKSVLCAEYNASEIKSKDWNYISDEVFDGKHTADECKERYEKHLHPALEKEWSNEDICSLHSKVMSGGYFWEKFEKIFSVPAVVIMKKYYETIGQFEVVMRTMDKSCSWLPRQLWVDDADISD